MVTLLDVLDWVEEHCPECPRGTIGTIDKELSETIGIFDNPEPIRQPYAIGRGQRAGYYIRPIGLVLRYGNSAARIDELAARIYDAIVDEGRDAMIGGSHCWIVAYRRPVILPPDEKGIYEAWINFDVYVRR